MAAVINGKGKTSRKEKTSFGFDSFDLESIPEYFKKMPGRIGVNRREFLKSQMGLAALFLSANSFFGPFFRVDRIEAYEKDAADEQSNRLEDQFIFDDQVHYLHDDYPSPGVLLELRRAAELWNPEEKEKSVGPEDLEFESFVREIFHKSQTKLALLSNAPADDPNSWFISNDQALQTRQRINETAGKRRLLAHAVFTPGQPGWMDQIDEMIEKKPDAWKGYTLGDPSGTSRYPWRLDDEKLVYPAYEKMKKSGIRNVCVHKGLLSPDFEKSLRREQIICAGVGDLAQAAKDWPDLNFIIYHSAIKKITPDMEDTVRFRKTGRIDWVTELAEIPEQSGVKNVYGDIGSTFATACSAQPELCAGILGTLIRGLGPEHVCWGTDSVWYGTPQWQIEAMRRIEIPEDMQKNYGFKPLGPADGKIKNAVFGENSARLYGIQPAQHETAPSAA